MSQAITWPDSPQLISSHSPERVRGYLRLGQWCWTQAVYKRRAQPPHRHNNHPDDTKTLWRLTGKNPLALLRVWGGTCLWKLIFCWRSHSYKHTNHAEDCICARMPPELCSGQSCKYIGFLIKWINWNNMSCLNILAVSVMAQTRLHQVCKLWTALPPKDGDGPPSCCSLWFQLQLQLRLQLQWGENFLLPSKIAHYQIPPT